MPDFLLEIGTEELPAAYIPPAIEQLRSSASAALKALGIELGEPIATATPRRLVLFIPDLPIAQAARTDEIAGPPEKAGYKDGQPTKAATGFAEKNGVRVEDLIVRDTPKGRYLYATKRVEGRHVEELLAEIMPALIRGINFPKSMRWPQSPGTNFPRPVRRLAALFGSKPVAIELCGVKATRTTVGHPFLDGARELPIEKADYGAFRTLLRGHSVVVDRNERRASIEQELKALFERHGADFQQYELLEEVTDLVEEPHVMEGGFEERYLRLPAEVVEAAMTDHQRFFPIRTRDGKLKNRFAFVANRPKKEEELIREGNERVLRARLDDSEFYLQEDLKRTLAERVDSLKGIVFFDKLGTMLEKTARLEFLTKWLSNELKQSREDHVAAERAARLCKADLTTELVKEFPQLQGAVGAKYATLQGEGDPVARAILEHYMPRFSGDELPKTPAGLALSLAEKLDNLCGFFSIGQVPSGSADPFQLRRQAAGVVRMILERSLALPLKLTLETAAQQHEKNRPKAETAAAVLAFVSERVKNLFLEQGFRYDLVDAAIASGGDDILDWKRKLEALVGLTKDARFHEIVELVERTFNISKALDDPKAGLGGAKPVRADLLKEEPEKAVHAALEGVRAKFEAACNARDLAGAARLYLDALGAPVHEFFAKVFINVEEKDVRVNRLSLLREIHDLFARRIADLTKVVEGKK